MHKHKIRGGIITRCPRGWEPLRKFQLLNATPHKLRVRRTMSFEDPTQPAGVVKSPQAYSPGSAKIPLKSLQKLCQKSFANLIAEERATSGEQCGGDGHLTAVGFRGQT